MNSTLFRVTNILARVSGYTLKCELQYMISSILSIAKKIVYRHILKWPCRLNGWMFSDCIIHVRFKDVSFDFHCPRDSTFITYMNPYAHEYDISTFLAEKLNNGDVFIDVGAMGGKYSIIASKLVGEHGRVFSVEPNPMNLKVLRDNIRLNGLKNVTVIEKAIGNRSGNVKFYYDDRATETTSILKGDGHKHSFEAEMTTLDSLFGDVPFAKVLKADTEGCDADVLEGGHRILRRTTYVIVEENDRRIREILAEAGFNLIISRLSKYLIATKQ